MYIYTHIQMHFVFKDKNTPGKMKLYFSRLKQETHQTSIFVHFKTEKHRSPFFPDYFCSQLG